MNCVKSCPCKSSIFTKAPLLYVCSISIGIAKPTAAKIPCLQVLALYAGILDNAIHLYTDPPTDGMYWCVRSCEARSIFLFVLFSLGLGLGLSMVSRIGFQGSG